MYPGGVRRLGEDRHGVGRLLACRLGEDRRPACRRDPSREGVRPEACRPDSPGGVREVDPTREDSPSCRSGCDSGSRDARPKRGCCNDISNREEVFYARPDTRDNRPIRDHSIGSDTSVRRDAATTIRFGKICPPEHRERRKRPFQAE